MNLNGVQTLNKENNHLLKFWACEGGGWVKDEYHLHGNQRPHTIVFAFTEIHMKKRSDKNSATSAVAGFAGVIDDAILPPAGVELRSDKEHLIWNQFTRAGAKEDWRCTDLILLAQIVKM